MIGQLFRRFWAWPWELGRAGVLGMNHRQARYTLRLNPRAFFPRVDDKSLTKTICEANGVPTPETFLRIERFGDVVHFAERLGERREFVIKPGRGSAGRGILVIADRADGGYRTSGGALVSEADMRYHLACALAGQFSLGGNTDRVIVERRLRRHPVFADLAVDGTPDIRVIVYRAHPIMAMTRLPTRMSGGRANLHQGAVGAGIDLDTGVTLNGVWRGEHVTTAPDTGAPLAGVQIPHWPEILDIASRLSRALELGYVGVDIVLDAEQGPVVLEANARPGLGIQVANQRGLLPAIRRADARMVEAAEAQITEVGGQTADDGASCAPSRP